MTEKVYHGTLKQALADGTIKAGDRLLLKDGVYRDDYLCSLSGVTIMSYPNEHAKIDGSLYIQGENLSFGDLEILYSGWTTRQSQEAGSNPSDIPKKDLIANGVNVNFINCDIHDLRTFFLGYPGGDIVGCHIYNIGWVGTDRGHGHGVYSQNGAPSPQKHYAYNLVHGCFAHGFQIWDEVTPLSNYLSEYNVIFANGSSDILHGGQNTISDNVTYKNNLTGRGDQNGFGYQAGITNLRLIDNYFPGGVALINCEVVEESGNYYGPAIGNQVFCLPHKTGARVVIYNEAQVDTIEVDVFAIYANGVQVQARNVQDYFIDIQTLTVTAGKITINMQAENRTVAAPIGWTAPATTFPTFGCFVLEAS